MLVILFFLSSSNPICNSLPPCPDWPSAAGSEVRLLVPVKRIECRLVGVQTPVYNRIPACRMNSVLSVVVDEPGREQSASRYPSGQKSIVVVLSRSSCGESYFLF